MSFPQLKLTDAGKALIIKALAGETIEFTKIGIGNGEVPDNANQITQLQNTIDSIAINSITIGDGCANMEGTFDNTDYEAGFWWKEMGVFATDPDAGEVLYAYAHAEDKAEYIPPYSETTLVKTTVNVTVVIGEAANVTAILGEHSGFVTNEDFRDHITNYNNPHRVTKEQIGLNLVENKVVNDLAPTYTESEMLIQMTSGEKIKIAFGKIAKAISTFIKHLQESNPHKITTEKIKAAKENHSHSTNDITSGVLSIERGGTGTKSVEDLAAKINESVQNPYIGSYVGNGLQKRFIRTLNFTPSAVFITTRKGQLADSEIGTRGGLVLKGKNLICSTTTTNEESYMTNWDNTHVAAQITDNGFFVNNSSLLLVKKAATNVEDEVYYFLAFR